MKKYIKKFLVVLENVCNDEPFNRNEFLLLMDNLNISSVGDIHHDLNNDLFYTIAKNISDGDLLKLIIDDIGIEKLKTTKLINHVKVSGEYKEIDGFNIIDKCILKFIDRPDLDNISLTNIIDINSGRIITRDEWK